mgnify:CR=1 FL=1
MISLVQRVLEAKVHIENREFSAIKGGLLIFVCIEDSDTNESIQKMSEKLINFKMLDGSKGIASCSLKETKEEWLEKAKEENRLHDSELNEGPIRFWNQCIPEKK